MAMYLYLIHHVKLYRKYKIQENRYFFKNLLKLPKKFGVLNKHPVVYGLAHLPFDCFNVQDVFNSIEYTLPTEFPDAFYLLAPAGFDTIDTFVVTFSTVS